MGLNLRASDFKSAAYAGLIVALFDVGGTIATAQPDVFWTPSFWQSVVSGCISSFMGGVLIYLRALYVPPPKERWEPGMPERRKEPRE